ncbi:SfnB family sulfur acquisition oxidoreductase [Variovorax paradoxus]|jgi:SfnB family sulfur acquisition oxidoreductase|uniref:SfnB family sulfur acquisition oxidoreductase n=1 Tax=Variovorax paradoxus TaxID=34073 RepID=UPI0006E6DEBF|nr:SfnB family sulfur acquisition oxidoreductase [Variovorax paradoxus]KPV11042.1 SfnB family sulfur acquisition oxidoreductase [Variovorax paradoxus]KPV13451.1 SfnB family sulfur acquisition oxidoreductase [Variovorax paradoxus]KPV24296.1 SfnB family sulfur acquisition oxidoreductase [Variovorax paradoxus]KPV31577.1 SfnB family sulfur acquisition oxidoreductase [Variovorax paradoxus]
MTAPSSLSTGPVHVVRDDAEALAIARRLAADFATGASERDRQRRLPFEEIERFSASGLWGITVPRSFGGAAVSHATLAEVTALISEADPALGQIPQNHYCLVDAVRLIGDAQQQTFFFREAIEGRRFGNAVSESGTANAKVVTARLRATPEGLRLDGRKFYCTGALFAHWVPVAARDEQDNQVLVYVAREAPGLEVVDDWSGFGQRTTASGTVTADNVAVGALQVLPRARLFEPPTIHGPFAQVLHAAIDLGIGRAAMADLHRWVRDRARPWPDSGVARAADDPLTLARIGRLVIQQHAAEALLERSGRALDRARDEPGAAHVTEASIAVAEAKVLSTEFALEAATALIELAGTQSTLAEHNLDRHWRNARTHTVHDPVRWKPHAVGNHWLNGASPQRHASI